MGKVLRGFRGRWGLYEASDARLKIKNITKREGEKEEGSEGEKRREGRAGQSCV